MIVLEHGVAFNVTPTEFRILLANRAAGIVEPADCYGFEVGAYGGDLSTITAEVAAEALKAIDERLGLGAKTAELSVDEIADRVAAAVEEEGVFFPLPAATRAA